MSELPSLSDDEARAFVEAKWTSFCDGGHLQPRLHRSWRERLPRIFLWNSLLTI